MEQLFMIIGAAILGILGLIHWIYTFYTNKFDAYDPAVTEAMKSTSVVLTKETTVWRAWIGFNASHSLGAMLVAGVYIPLTISYFEVIQNSVWFSVLPVITGASYLTLAKKYWFKIPFTGILIATVCFVIAAFMINV